jgi:hypothetical protein
MSVPAARPVRVSARIDDALFVAIGLSWAAAFVHVAASAWHLHEYGPYAGAFALLAAIQFAWGGLAYRRPSRPLLVGGALLNLGTVAVWLASRTTGLPIGPERWQPEQWGLPDIAASADEVALVLLLVCASGRLARLFRSSAIALGVALILLSVLTLVSGGHSH